MRQFAGAVCEIITVAIYGFAVICGILYSKVYIDVYLESKREPEFTAGFYVVWLILLAIAAVVSCIHHALASIIDNQCVIYGRLEEVKEMLEEQQRGNQLPSDRSEIATSTSNSNLLQNSDTGTEHLSREWVCSECGTKNHTSICTCCGHIRD